MAIEFHKTTGKPVEAWCYIQGSRPERVFWRHELPVLQKLESAGIVKVHFAKETSSRWNNPTDWFHGTDSAMTARDPNP